jgi:hypothetical protein
MKYHIIAAATLASDYRSKDFYHADAVYQRNKDGNTITRDNCHVVSYNVYLLKKYNCHINVECVGGIKSLKYLYKYIYKGHDSVTIKLVGDDKQIVTTNVIAMLKAATSLHLKHAGLFPIKFRIEWTP